MSVPKNPSHYIGGLDLRHSYVIEKTDATETRRQVLIAKLEATEKFVKRWRRILLVIAEKRQDVVWFRFKEHVYHVLKKNLFLVSVCFLAGKIREVSGTAPNF
jgi:hypothetical protein